MEWLHIHCSPQQNQCMVMSLLKNGKRLLQQAWKKGMSHVVCAPCTWVITTSTLFLGYSQIVMMEVNPWHATQKDKSFHLHRRTAGEYRCLLRRYCVIGVQLLVYHRSYCDISDLKVHGHASLEWRPCDLHIRFTTCTIPANVSVYVLTIMLFTLPSWHLMTYVQPFIRGFPSWWICSTCMHLSTAIYTLLWHMYSTSLYILYSILGILAGIRPCGIVVMLTELFTAESKSQVYVALHELLTNHTNIASNLSEYGTEKHEYVCWFMNSNTYFFKPEFVCYDDGCPLRRYATNPCRRNLTPQSIQLANTEIVIDKLHMAGHTDTWCRQHCDPKSFKELDNVSYIVWSDITVQT